MSDQKLEWSKIKPLLPTSFHIHHESGELYDSPKLCQTIIESNNLDILWDEIESKGYSDDLSYEKEMIAKTLHYHGYSNTEQILEQFVEEIESHIYENDESDSIGLQLYINTREIILFYDLGYEMEPDSWKWNQPRVNKEIAAIKKILKIPSKTKEFDSDLELMIRQANYGGNLVLYFKDRLRNVCTLDDEKDFQSLIVNGTVNIAVIDLAGGSGDYCEVKTHTAFPFNRSMLKVCEAMANSFTYNVCCLVENWCANSKVSFSEKKVRGRKRKNSPESTKIYEKEKEYNAVFASGKCSFGDINFSRHRDTYYVTDFPMGNKCPHCGQFWID